MFHVCAWYPEKLEESIKSPGTGVRCGCTPQASKRQTSVRPQELLISEPSLYPSHPQSVLFVRVNGVSIGEGRESPLAGGMLWVGHCQVGSKDLEWEREIVECSSIELAVFTFLSLVVPVIPVLKEVLRWCQLVSASVVLSCPAMTSCTHVVSWVLYYIFVKISFFVL